jgi:lipid-A-disaccharide synthase
MARYFDLVLALLPFEPDFFAKNGLQSIFVGHPVVERASLMRGGDVLRARLGLAADAPLLAVLPGSRMNEVRLLLPPFREAVRILREKIPDLVCILPVVDHVGEFVRGHTRDWPSPLHLVEGDADKFAAFDAADVALAASGTVTTELALAGTPMAVAYRLGPLTFALVRPFVKVRFITLANILLDRTAVPEFVQGACTGEALAAALIPLLTNENARRAQQRELAQAVAKLGLGGERPSIRAARALLRFVRSVPENP